MNSPNDREMRRSVTRKVCILCHKEVPFTQRKCECGSTTFDIERLREGQFARKREQNGPEA